MDPPIRILIVDDSALIRRLLHRAFEPVVGVEVAGTAPNGKIALEKVHRLQPDAVILDLEMPELDGLDMLRELKRQGISVPVIVFSSLTYRGAEATFQALQLGARDYVTKPTSMTDAASAMEEARAELVPRIRAFCRTRSAAVVEQSPVNSQRPFQRAFVRGRPESRSAEAIVVGVSTGGPSALQTLVSALPDAFPLPIFVVQHMPPLFTELLAERLDASGPLSVVEATDGEPVGNGKIYIAPGGRHMKVERVGHAAKLVIVDEAAENSCRPSVDVLFRSAVEAFRGRLIAVMLTGMGADGLDGCGLIRAAGGTIVAQDRDSSVVWGMPGAVAKAGLADQVLPLGDIAGTLVRLTANVSRLSPPLTAEV